jgi:hypothetical protein
MTALQLLVVALASYRVTRFLVRDSLIGFGPDSGSRMSMRLDRFAYTPEGEDRSYLRGKVGDLLTCVWCLGFWVSAVTYTVAAVALGAWGDQPFAWHTVAIFGVAGAQGYLSSRMNA